VWVVKLPWIEVVECGGKLNFGSYKVCNEFDGKEKLLVPKFNHL
jgi:hypothetical protein